MLPVYYSKKVVSIQLEHFCEYFNMDILRMKLSQLNQSNTDQYEQFVALEQLIQIKNDPELFRNSFELNLMLYLNQYVLSK